MTTIHGWVIVVEYPNQHIVLTPREGHALYTSEANAAAAARSRGYGGSTLIHPATLTIHDSVPQEVSS